MTRAEAVSRRASRDDGLFPSEAEIARRLSQTPQEWVAKACVLERDGLPRVDSLMGGRYWPAVCMFFHARYGLSGAEALAPDGPENLDAL
ncbi:hypothetical protein ACRAWG_00330 [Methylobacterium sp. P31]